MAQPRPATPNYLEEVNRARQQSRSSRRQRVDGIINPMDSAAAMDRMQGVDVSGFSSGGADSPPINLAGMLASGGAGTATKSSPFRTAAGSNASPTTVSQTQCPGGRCNINRGMQFPCTVVMSEPIVTSASPMPAPVQSTVDVGDPESLVREGVNLMRSGPLSNDPSYRGTSVTVGQSLAALGETGKARKLAEGQLALESSMSQRAAALAERAMDAQEPLLAAQVKAANELTMQGSGEQRTAQLDAVADGQLSVPDYVTGQAELHSRASAEQGKPLTPEDAATLRAGWRQQGYAALAARSFIFAQDAASLAKAGGNVDPTMGRQMMQAGVASLANSYTKEGLFSKDWATVQTQINQDLMPVLERGFLEADMRFKRSELDALPDNERAIRSEEIRLQSQVNALAAFNGISDELYERHTQQDRGVYKSSIGYLQNFLNNLDYRARDYEKTFPGRTDADVNRSEVERGGGPHPLPGGMAFP